jgi:hypothetical protein
MKHVVVILSVLVLLGSLSTTLYGETRNPYPPPPLSGVTNGGTSMNKGASAPSGEAILADLILVRPMSFAAWIVGAGLNLIALPFTSASHTTNEVADRLVNEPFEFTFARPLGEF